MNKSVFVSGSSHGIGAAAAVEFAKNGYDVGINGNKNPQSAEEVLKKCLELGVKAKLFLGDVTKHDCCKKMMEDFIDYFGKIDVLINNAGGALQIPDGPKGEFKDMPMEYWDSQIALNLNSAAYLSRYAAEDMIKKGIKGSIINVSSIHSQVTWVHRRMLPYSAGKGGLNMFTKSLGVELIKYGINVNGIAPGLIFTKATDRYSEADLQSFSRKIPYGNGGTVDDIVPMMLFLADKEKSRFIVGQTIFIDGGQSVDGSIESMNFNI